jgi:hypothetical protein
MVKSQTFHGLSLSALGNKAATTSVARGLPIQYPSRPSLGEKEK